MTAQRAPLPAGRWHFQHGPIDLVIRADGAADVVAAAHDAAWARFTTVLHELVAELPMLRSPVAGPCALQGVVARRMWQACRAVRHGFITPMAAVAGAVADELIACYRREGITRAWVNNGGDIALHLTPGHSVNVGLVADLAQAALTPRSPLLDGRFAVEAAQPVRGVATSGWRGRSFSLGIADSVTVLARGAAVADAAATLVANAVDLPGDPRVLRRPALELKDDTDLGDLLVTVDVLRLDDAAVQCALARGAQRARELQSLGLIWAAVLTCQGATRIVEPVLASGRPGASAALSRDPSAVPPRVEALVESAVSPATSGLPALAPCSSATAGPGTAALTTLDTPLRAALA